MLDVLGAQFGIVPNVFRLMGQSSSALAAYVACSTALSKTLNAKTRQRIALAVAEVCGCDYCLSAQCYLASNAAKLDEAEIEANRRGTSNDAKADVAVAFAKKVAELRGKVSDADVAAVKRGGYSDAQVIEIVLNVGLGVLLGLVNNVAMTDIDFPVVRTATA
jgi:AhpD family alkylhydroperoxidase